MGGHREGGREGREHEEVGQVAHNGGNHERAGHEEQWSCGGKPRQGGKRRERIRRKQKEGM